MTEEERSFAEEVQRLEDSGYRVNLVLGAGQAIALIAQVQLACRHPGNLGPTRAAATAAARNLEEALAAESPELGRLIEKGWHAVFDVPRQHRTR